MDLRFLPGRLKQSIRSATFLLLAVFSFGSADAQQVTIATGLPSSASSGSSTGPSVVTFCIANNRPTPVTLVGLDNYMSTSNASTVWKLFYSSTSLSGTPNVTTWTVIDSIAGPTVTGTGIFGLFPVLNFSIPANTTYRFAVQTTASIINYGGAATTPTSQSIANIELSRGSYTIGGANVGYAGTASSPPFSPRFFCGTVYLDTALVLCNSTPSAAVITTPAFTAATAICAGSNTTLNATDPNVGAGISYQWQSAAAAAGPWTNVGAGTGSTTLSYTTAPITANTYFRVGVTCSLTNVTTYTAPFLVPIGSPQPGLISGPGNYCPGDPLTFSVPAMAGGTFAWTLPTGWTGTSTTNSITVTPGAGTASQNISVTVTTPCGPASAPRTRSVLPGSAPAVPASVIGSQYVCGNTSQTFSVAPVSGATSYIWTLPTGWTGTSTTNTITTGVNTTSGNVSVRAVNGCGPSLATNFAVTVITSLASPGRITGSDTVCSGALHTFSIKPVNGATSYSWTLPNGWSGTTSGTSIQAFAGTTSGRVSVTAYVACATSPVSDTAVLVIPSVTPTVSISAPTTTICQGTPVTFTATSAFGGTAPAFQWKKNGVAISASGTTYTTNSLAAGDSVSVTLTSSAACATSRTVVSNTLIPTVRPSVTPGVSINTVPPIITCKNTPVTFTTTSNGTGTTPSYKWYRNGVEIVGVNGTTYTTSALNHADTITIELTTSAVCPLSPTALSNKVGVTVNDSLTPGVAIAVSPDDLMNGDPKTFTAVVTNGGATPDYQWMRNGVMIPFATNSTYTSSDLRAGDHISLRLYSYAPCTKSDAVFSNSIVLKSSVGVPATAGSTTGLSLYPNPSQGRFNVSLKGWGAGASGEQMRLEIFNALGQIVHRVELAPKQNNSAWETQVQLDASLANGSYLLRLSGAQGGVLGTVPFLLKR